MKDRRLVDVGNVIFLEPAVLEEDAEILCPISPSEKARPYVCLAMENDLSVWLALTSQPGKITFPSRRMFARPRRRFGPTDPAL